MHNKILSIAGSDSCGGAGIQADIKTATALKTYIATAITCITVQNTKKVSEVLYLPADLVQKQIATVLEDIEIDAIKIGMVGNKEIIEAVSEILKSKAKNIPIILDPVMIATSGDSLLKDDAILSLKENLLKNCYLVTPNIPEAELLSEMKIENAFEMKIAAKKIINLGAKNVLIKGGHIKLSENKIYNLLLKEDKKSKIFSNKKLKVGDIHGTGCSLSSAIACLLKNRKSLDGAVRSANNYIFEAIKNGKKIGSGSRILQHF